MQALFFMFQQIGEMPMSDKVVNEQTFKEGLEATFAQVIPFFVELTADLTAYQLNLIRAICAGYHDDFGKKEVTSQYDLGSRIHIINLNLLLMKKKKAENCVNSGKKLGSVELFSYFCR